MAITLLIDLDDTLLDVNTQAFLPAYYEALSRHLSSLVPPQAMLDALRSGVQQMMLNRDPSRTLQEIFEAHFYPALGQDPEVLRGKIMEFYREVYPGLRRLTHPKPGGRELMEWARAAGHELLLATDPLFPEAATLERVRWTGLDPKAFSIISTFETFHFSKTHPAFFAEMLGRLGWPDRPALMAGNDVERDLVPAQKLGIAAFHVDGTSSWPQGPSGDLHALRSLIQEHAAEIEAASFNTRESHLAVLEATPAVLQSLTAGLTAAEWSREPSADEWAIIELVCHLRDTEREVHSVQLTTLVEADDPFVARPDAAYWAKQRRYLAEDGPAAIREFAAARKSTLERLYSVPAQMWQKSARHAIFGPTNFLEVVGFMAEHDRIHLGQARRTLHPEAEPAHRN